MREALQAPGRLEVGAPTAIVDIGSNSVRLVAYEGRTRAPTPIFNEKAFCGLGRGVLTTGRLGEEAMERALAALARFRVLCRTMGASDLQVIATAAAREARNGADFLDRAARAIGAPITLLAGRREAELSALGVVSAVHDPDGVVGDLGGGSLELIDVRGARIGRGETMPLGGLALMDASGKSLKQAQKIARAAIGKAAALENLRGRTFYAVGGTWRALARLHMSQTDYPLSVMHNFAMTAPEAADFGAMVESVDSEQLKAIEEISAQRRPLLAYGAVVLDEIIRQAKPAEIVVSAAGVREGMLYEQLPAQVRALDPLLSAAAEFNQLRARAPAHAEELHAWADAFFRSTGREESPEDARLRHAACLLSDIAWRAHPDYRGPQAFDLVANSSLVGVDHPGRLFLAIALAVRYIGLNEDLSPRMRALTPLRYLERARILGAAMRVAYIVSTAMPGVLARTPLLADRKSVTLTLPADLRPLASDRLFNRLKQLGKLIGREAEIVVGH